MTCMTGSCAICLPILRKSGQMARACKGISAHERARFWSNLAVLFRHCKIGSFAHPLVMCARKIHGRQKTDNAKTLVLSGL